MNTKMNLRTHLVHDGDELEAVLDCNSVNTDRLSLHTL